MSTLRALILAAAIAAAGCRPAPRTTVFIDPALATLVPSDTIVLAGVRMEKLRDTPLYKAMLADLPLPGVQEFQRQTGLDPRKDLWEFLVAGNGRQSVIMCRGKFGEFGLEPKLPRSDMQRFAYKKYLFLGDEQSAITFTNSTTAIAGPTALLRWILDNRDKGLAIPKSLLPQVNAVPPESQIWIAGDLGAGLSGLNPRDYGDASNFAQFARSIEAGWAGLDVRSGLALRASVRCRSDQEAQRINSTLRAVVGMARLSTPPERTDLLQAWDSVRSEIQEGRSVKVNAELSEPQIQAMYQFGKTRLRGSLPGRSQ